MKYIFKKISPTWLQSFIKNKLFAKTDSSPTTLTTSLSDNQIYPDFCFRASTDSRVFSNFRRSRVYTKILENVRYEVGQGYLDEIVKNNPALLTDSDVFRQNDKWGYPEQFEYPQIGKICPSTLRYIKVFGDLLTLFKPIDNLKICEIGVGYGGQCRILCSGANPSHYTLVDLKPALMLAQRYLDNYILNAVLRYQTMNELETQDYDLFISNYAFTELPRNIQDVYLKKVILNSKRGYITYNDISPDYFKSYKKEELISIIPKSRIIQEKPLTNHKNCIIVWGD